MSGVLRRGSLNFDRHGSRGSLDGNLSDETKQVPRTPEVSVIALDFRRHSNDLKKDVRENENSDVSPRDLSQDIDSDVISNFIGHYRKWSFLWTFILCLFQVPTTFHLFMHVFYTTDKDFWCARPPHLMNVSVFEWRNRSQTGNGCSLLNIDYNEVAFDNGQWLNWPENSSNAGYVKCPEFEFSDVDGVAQTLVQEFGLVCDRQTMGSVVEMCFLAGAAVGAVLSGWISDRFGRRHTLMIFATIQTFVGGLLAFSRSLTMYMSLRVIDGFACMTVTVVGFVLVVELVSGKWRTIIGILNILPVAISYVLASGLAYLIRDWRTLQNVISWPFLALLCIWYWLPESPRWLLAQGRIEELVLLIRRAARMNGTSLPDNFEKTLEAAVPVSAAENGNCSEGDCTAAQPNPLFVVFNKQYLRTTLLTLLIWLNLIIIYFGLTLHLNNLGGHVYENNAIAGSLEAVSICISIFVVLKFGIRRSLIAYMLIPGLCCLGTNLVPHGSDSSPGVIALAIIAKCLIGANNAIIPTYTAMQYPTVVRNFGLGMGNMASGVGLILVPYVWLLERYDSLLPLNIMGVCGIIGAVAILLMKDVN
ncbi:organic cation transporter protein [Scaptodrosophila lebanonensis]|uniref:Organic cation transporter protein n=1 Tax=Drosophila lebanonensis TaxID=7225 RepID=A0A6J2T478_DROLE|nr:organic cation transporter protein [Scaptodrosophila lebanonensis]